MTALTPEIKHAIEQAGDELVLLEDPQTRQTYVLLKSDDYGRRSRRRLTFLRHEVALAELQVRTFAESLTHLT